MVAVENFCDTILAKFSRLDAIIQNGAPSPLTTVYFFFYFLHVSRSRWLSVGFYFLLSSRSRFQLLLLVFFSCFSHSALNFFSFLSFVTHAPLATSILPTPQLAKQSAAPLPTMPTCSLPNNVRLLRPRLLLCCNMTPPMVSPPPPPPSRSEPGSAPPLS